MAFTCGRNEITGEDVAAISIGVGVTAGICTAGTLYLAPTIIIPAGAVIPAAVAGTCIAAGAVWWLVWETWH